MAEPMVSVVSLVVVSSLRTRPQARFRVVQTGRTDEPGGGVPDYPERMPDRLLGYLAAELGCPRLAYASPPERLAGGFDTSIFSFQLAGSPEALAGPLVLRLYPADQGVDKAKFEGVAQNALVEVGVPASPVHLICSDINPLGGACIVMDRLPGRRLIDVADDRSSMLLGRAHAELHDAPAEPVVESLAAAGFHSVGMVGLLDWLAGVAIAHPWIRPSVDWLGANRPSEPALLSICHGDFHKLNVLVDEERLTGILDWSALTVADPVFDVATTVMLFTIPARHLMANGMFPHTDLDQVVADYVAAYEACRPLATDLLDYYLALRCLRALSLGLVGKKLWRHDGIVSDLAHTVERVTGHSPLRGIGDG